jgi:glycosyltransferase involved in cell wall biosynthesis
LYRFIKRSFHGPADINVINYYYKLKEILKKEHFDYVLLENLSSLNAVSLIKRHSFHSTLIYDAHNFESGLCNSSSKKKSYYIINKESNLYKLVDQVWVCSLIDKELFEKLNGNRISCTIIPNAVSIKNIIDFKHIPNKKNNLIFCGSFDYLPNEEGLIWFVENCWGDLKKIFPSIKLIVIGSGCKSNTLKLSLLKEGIEDIGYVKDVSEFYKSAKIAVVPINKGSGTRLKILEAMSFALPVVSTSKGAEGIDYTNDENILISDNHIGFVKCIEHLILKEEMQSYIGMNALNLIKQKYDWNIVGKKIKKQLA